MRVKVYSLILIVCLLFLFSGLFYIQVVRHENYKVMSEENRLKVTPLMAPRGNIYDRNGEYIVKNKLSFNPCVIYSQIRDVGELSKVLGDILGEKDSEIRKRIEKAKKTPYKSYCIAQDVGIEKAVRFEEIDHAYPGLVLDVSAKREYVYGKVASSIIGYLGLINRPEFDRLKHYGYRVNDLVGRSGVEKYYDNYLRGTHGGKQVEVDHLGRELRTLGYKEASPGKDIYLTIDIRLQEYCNELLEGKKGAIIVLDPRTGAVLALASAPAYDPEIFIDRTRAKDLKRILKDRDYPLINRAIKGAYPPGSVFKVIIATAALEIGKLTTDTSFFCSGSFTLGRKTFRCWKKGGHGEQVVREAIKNSCNVFFYRTGLLLGVDNIYTFGEKFGFGQRTGIDLPGENKGLLPSRQWKRKRFNEKWYKGETVNYAIGQGYLLVTPIQMTRVMSVFANGGKLVRPYVVSKVAGVDVSPHEDRDLEISASTLEIVRDGLKKVVNDPRGTGMKARLKGVVVSGKTGTAQTPPGKKNHGWFAGFAPHDDPVLTVLVFDEYGGKGGYYAAGTASKVFKKARELELL